MLFQATALEKPYDNHFYNPWVRDIDLSLMLKLDPGEDSVELAHHGFSARVVEREPRKLRDAAHGAPVDGHCSANVLRGRPLCYQPSERLASEWPPLAECNHVAWNFRDRSRPADGAEGR